MTRLSLVALCILCCSLARSGEGVDFGREIEPILKEQCVHCHGAEEQNGGLRLDFSEGAFAETDSGLAAIVPGDTDASELLQRVISKDEGDRMPPEGDRLSSQQIQSLRKWIQAGAKWPEANHDVSEERGHPSHWSFLPIADPEPPHVDDSRWATSDLDRFIQARREEEGLQPSPAANPHALIRRATYGLTGLPPTPQQVVEFKDRVNLVGISAAMSELVDDLLSRPSYGQRWGRHWMDWVRYADTAGDNSDYPIPQAYLYRNYIIDALNDDVPYDRFLQEQLAGDLLDAETLEERNRLDIATGYLAMARRFGSLIERYPWHLTIEDTIDNVGRTMMGLTLSCARCHDHKFDPISTRDYYALYGIFQSTRYPFPGIELFKSQWNFVSLLDDEQTATRQRDSAAKTLELERKLQSCLDACEEKLIDNARREKESTIAQRRKMHGDLEHKYKLARKAGEALAAHLRTINEYPTAYAVSEGEPVNAHIQIKGEPSRPGATVPRGFPQVLGGQRIEEDDQGSGRLQLAHWITSPQNPLTARVIVNRVWQRHFGTGLVSSTSDFGLRGQTPTHPQLLDFLAKDLIANGWSIKHLHRRIMNSRTYQLSCDENPSNLLQDPSNQYYWRFNPQRLDAESIRDTLLMLGGTLDPTPQSQPYPFPPRDKWEFTQHHPFNQDYASNKRSVYLMTRRLTAKPYFQTFDGPDPNVCTSRRDQSVTALQALYFVNDQFVHQQSKHFAKKIIQSSRNDQQRIEFAFQQAFCRRPTSSEADKITDHIKAVKQRLDDDELASWSSVTRSLFRLNEFVYLD